MATNIEVEKSQQDSTANLIRRFTKRMQGSGIIPRLRSERYFQRTKSGNVAKAKRIKKLEKKEKYEKLLKLGKIQEQSFGRRRR